MKRSFSAGIATGIGAAVVAGVASVALLAGTISPALADETVPDPTASPSASPSASATTTPRTLAEIQAAAKVKTDKRIASLTTAISRATANAFLTDADRATILDRLNADLAGMKTTEAKIAADTDRATAATDYATIFTTYRVYAVALPQSRIAATADRMTGSAIPKLTAVQKKLAAALAGRWASKSTPELQAKLADMTTQIDAASALVDGLAAKALAVTPADYNADHDVMKPLRADAKSAAADLKRARADARSILIAVKPGTSSSSSSDGTTATP